MTINFIVSSIITIRYIIIIHIFWKYIPSYISNIEWNREYLTQIDNILISTQNFADFLRNEVTSAINFETAESLAQRTERRAS